MTSALRNAPRSWRNCTARAAFELDGIVRLDRSGEPNNVVLIVSHMILARQSECQCHGIQFLIATFVPSEKYKPLLSGASKSENKCLAMASCFFDAQFGQRGFAPIHHRIGSTHEHFTILKVRDGLNVVDPHAPFFDS